MQAAERYVLGDLSVSELEDFERHFFDCPRCSEELRILTVLQDNARAVFLEQSPRPAPASLPVPERGAGWWRGIGEFWLRPWAAAPALAAVLLAVLAGYQALVIVPGLRRQAQVQPVSGYPLYAAARGEETIVAPPAGARFYTLYMDRTWDREFSSYRAVVREESGTERYSVGLTAPAPGRPIQLLLPGQALAAGRYVVLIFGDSLDRETEVARFPFTLKFE